MKNYILLVAALFSLIACDSEDNYIDEPVAARISATIADKSLSRARDIAWENGDSIGVSMSDRYYNMKYVTENGNGIFAGTTMFFKNKQEPVTITAYYPFTGSEGEAPAVVEASTGAERQHPDEQAKFDFLYAALNGATGAQPNIDLPFSHKMSKLTFIFKSGNKGTKLSKINSYTIEGLVHDGTFDPVTGDCAAKSDAEAKPITMAPISVEEGTALPSLIVFPQTVDKLTLIINDIENQDYSCELNFGDNGLEPGNSYLFTITVKKTELSVNLTADQSIINWETEPSNGNAFSDD